MRRESGDVNKNLARNLFVLAMISLVSVVGAQNDSMWICDPTGVYQYDASTGEYWDVYAYSPLGTIGAFDFSPDGKLCVVDSSVGIRRFDLGTGLETSSFAISGTWGLTYGPDSNIYTYYTGQVRRYNGSTGAYIDVFVPSGYLSSVRGMHFEGNGNLYAGSYSGNVVQRFNLSGANTLTFSGGDLTTPTDVALGPDGNIYVASSGTNQVLRYDGTTGSFSSIFVPAGSGGVSKVYGLDFGPDNRLYVVDSVGKNVLKYDGSTGAFMSVFASGVYGMTGPQLIEFTSSTRLEGQVELQDFLVGSAPIAVSIDLTPVSGGVALTEDVILGTDGAYSISDVATGTYDVSFKAAQFLPAVVNGVIVSFSATTPCNVSLSNGDSNGDSAVTGADQTIVLQNLDSTGD